MARPDPQVLKALDGALPPGHLFAGRYRIERRIGVGGMGAVYAASDEQAQRRVALKVIARHHTRDERQVQRFRREAQVVSQLKHPHVVQVFEVGAAEGREYLAMELLEGVDLCDAIQLTGSYEPKDAVAILDQTLDALDAAHAAGLVHRDLKPENVYLAQTETGEIRVRLLDFGVVKVPDEGAQAHLTRTGTVVGTPEYMAPEQATAGQVDGRADLYAVGCIAYAMLTGRPPFQNKSVLLLMQAHVTEKPKKPSELKPKLPPAVDAFVLRALAKKPADRYQNAADMRRALREVARTVGSDAVQSRITIPQMAAAKPEDLAPPPQEVTDTARNPPKKRPEPETTTVEPLGPARPATPWAQLIAAFFLGAALATLLTYVLMRR